MSSLEEKLRAYAAKGELVHLSLAFTNGEFHCNFAAATPASGYARASGSDPVEVMEAALKASPAKPKRPSHSQKRDSGESGAGSNADKAPSGRVMPDGYEPQL